MLPVPRSRPFQSKSESKTSSASHRTIIPSGRAVIGGLLVTTAAVGTFAAYMGAGQNHGRDYVVATRDIPTGHRITKADIRVDHGEITESIADVSFGSLAELEGAVSLAPMRANDLVQRSQIATTTQSAPEPVEEFSFAIDRERALNGSIRRGETVDVLATFGTGTEAYTAVVSRNSSVSDIADTGQSTIGSGKRIILTLALKSPDELIALAHASQVASLTIIRTTGADGFVSGPDRYQPASTRQDLSIPSDR